MFSMFPVNAWETLMLLTCAVDVGDSRCVCGSTSPGGGDGAARTLLSEQISNLK